MQPGGAVSVNDQPAVPQSILGRILQNNEREPLPAISAYPRRLVSIINNAGLWFQAAWNGDRSRLSSGSRFCARGRKGQPFVRALSGEKFAAKAHEKYRFQPSGQTESLHIHYGGQ